MKFKSLSIFWLALVLAVGVLLGSIGDARADTFYPTKIWYSGLTCGNGTIGAKFVVGTAYIGSGVRTGYQQFAFMNTGSPVAKEVYVCVKWDENDSSTWEWVALNGTGDLRNGAFSTTPVRIFATTMQTNVAYDVWKWHPANSLWLKTVWPDQVVFCFDNTIDGTLSLDCLSIVYPM